MMEWFCDVVSSDPCGVITIVLVVLVGLMVTNVIRRQNKIQNIINRINNAVDHTYIKASVSEEKSTGGSAAE